MLNAVKYSFCTNPTEKYNFKKYYLYFTFLLNIRPIRTFFQMSNEKNIHYIITEIKKKKTIYLLGSGKHFRIRNYLLQD